MPQKFDSCFNIVSGNEAERCKYPARLDTYGCGCQHNCGYCYARALLAFRGMWNPQVPGAASIREIYKIVTKKLRPGQVVRLGGMTDCFQPFEEVKRNTYRTIDMLNRRGVHYLIVTKNNLVATEPYLNIMRRDLAHIQISITSTSPEVSLKLEPGAPIPEKRISAVEKLQEAGFDVSVRLSPFIPELVDIDVIRAIKCDKILVEFLRVNAWIEKWLKGTRLPVDLTAYTHYHSGYHHLPLPDKIRLLKSVSDTFNEVSVCEDVPEHWEYWKNNVNANCDDCCNLRK